MKFKLIAAAAVLAASGVANAAIDRGLNSPGNGDFFLSIWDTAGSYTTDLGISQDQFTSALGASGAYSFSFDLMADANFAAFIGSANLAELQWNVLAVESVGQRRIHQTYTTLPDLALTASNGRTVVGAVQSFLGAVNDGMAAGANSAVFDSTQSGYAGSNLGCNVNPDYNNCGSVGGSLGLVLETYNGTGTARGAFAPLSDAGQPLTVSLNSSYNLQIAAVPEPETYAMLLAGLGLMGAVARRRQNKA